MPLLRRRDNKSACRLLAAAETALFVCHGNICRSPFAEGYARKLAPSRVRIHSAGFSGPEGRSSPPAARAMSARWGVDLDAHTSRIVTPEMMIEAGIVFVFDAENYLAVHRAWNQFRSKVHYIGNLDPSGPLIVDDPWEGSEELFDATYRTIQKHLDAAALRVGWT